MKNAENKSSNSQAIKTSFEPISDSDTEILILGSLPGDKSLELGEYYGHPGNRFWKIISHITGDELPRTYDEKKSLLLKSKIGVWDVVQKAERKGSSDSAIVNAEPNDLYGFIENHKYLRVIGFNGAKSESLYNRYFERKPGIRYVSLPGSSPANAKTSLESLCGIWRQLLT